MSVSEQHRRTEVTAMLALTFSTGIADAVGYLGLDRVFTGNMTGNVVILGMALGGGEDLPVVGPGLAMAAFMMGAAVGGRTLRRAPAGWSVAVTWLLSAVAVVLLGAAVFLLAVEPSSGSNGQVLCAASIALVMGVQAAAARHVAVKDVTTVVVTSTLTGLAADSRWGAAVPHPWVRRLLAVMSICAGAAVGAALLPVGTGWGLVPAAVVVLAAATLMHCRLRERRG